MACLVAWEGVDPDMRRTYSGPGAGAGAVYEWFEKPLRSVRNRALKVMGGFMSMGKLVGGDFEKRLARLKAAERRG